MVLADTAAERAVLAGICQYGNDAYLDVIDMISQNTFTIDSNSTIFSCLKYILEKDKDALVIDLPAIHSVAKELGVNHLLQKTKEAQHLQAILSFPVKLPNVRRFGAKIRKLEIARLLHQELEKGQGSLLELNGDESINHILGIAEDCVFDFTRLLNDSSDESKKLGENLEDYIKDLIDNPCIQMGIPTGFPKWDKSIGGGLRGGTVNVIGARPKAGKTMMAGCMGYYIATKAINETTGIPVLNMDTEMQWSDHAHRTLANITGIPTNDIEGGQVKSLMLQDKLLEEARKLKDIPLYHKSIAGVPFEDQLAIMRRWLFKEVGLNEDGTAKPCVIIYDYLKLMDTKGLGGGGDIKEYQLLGFMLTSLHNFTVRYNIPMLAFMQINRDGITKESTDIASGSDRIIWLCSNFSVFKFKSDEEIAEDGGYVTGNRKLKTLVSRHGSGLDDNDYINCFFRGDIARITEGSSKFEVEIKKVNSDEGFEVHDEEDDIPFE